MPLHGEVSLDFREALADLQAFRKELRATTSDPLTTTLNLSAKPAVSEARTAWAQIGRLEKQANAESAQLARQHAQNEKAAWSEVTRAARDADRERGQLTAQRTREEKAAWQEISRAASQSLADEKRAAAERTRLEKQLVTERTRDERAAWSEVTAAARQADRDRAAIDTRRTADERRAANERAQAEKAAWQEITRTARDADNQRGAVEKSRLADEKRDARERVRAEKEAEAEITRAARQAAGERERIHREAQAARRELAQGLSTGATYTGLGIGAGVVLAAKEAITFEESFTGVRKTVDATEAQLQQISKDLREMAAGKNPIPINVNELNAIAEAAGQLGIETKNVVGFTRVMADLGKTTDLTTDAAAQQGAQFANIMQMNQANFDRFGSTVVDLGNKSAATESAIVGMGLRIAGAGHQVHMSEADVLSYATALASVGVEAEAGGTAISKTFQDVDKAVRGGGKELTAYARIAGVSAAQFKKAFQTDAAGAIESYIAGLGRIQKSGGNVFGVLEALGVTERRQSNAMLALAGAGDLLHKTLDTGRRAWEQNTALTAEAEKRYKTTASQIEITKNLLRETAIEVQGATIPATRALLKEIQDVTRWFNSLDETTKEQIVKFGALATVALLVGGRIKGVVDTLALLRTATATASIATAAHTTALGTNAAAAETTGAANVTAANASAAAWLRAAGMITLGAAAAYAAYKSATEWTPDFAKKSDAELQDKYGLYGHFGTWGAGGDRGQAKREQTDRLLGKLGIQTTDQRLYDDYIEAQRQRRRDNPFVKTGEALPFDKWRAGATVQSGDVHRKPEDVYEEEFNKQLARMRQSLTEATKTAGAGTPDAAGIIAGLGGGKDGGRAATSLIDNIARGIRTPQGQASCASFASELLKLMGEGVKGSASARQLMQNAIAAGARPVGAAQAGPGDLVVWHGGDYGERQRGGARSGYHVGVYAGSGDVWESSGVGPGHQKRTEMHDAAHATFYHMPGGRGASRGEGAGLDQYGQRWAMQPYGPPALSPAEAAFYRMTQGAPDFSQSSQAGDKGAGFDLQAALDYLDKASKEATASVTATAKATRDLAQSEKDRADFLRTSRPDIGGALGTGAGGLVIPDTPLRTAEIEQQRRDIYNAQDLKDLREKADAMDKLGKAEEGYALRKKAADAYRQRFADAMEARRVREVAGAVDDASNRFSGLTAGMNEATDAASRLWNELLKGAVPLGTLAERRETAVMAFESGENELLGAVNDMQAAAETAAAAFEAGQNEILAARQDWEAMLADAFGKNTITPDFSPERVNSTAALPGTDPGVDIYGAQRDQAEQTRDLYREMFREISEGAMHMEQGVSGALDGILGSLQHMAQEMAAQWIFKELLGLTGLGDKTGGALFPASGPIPIPADAGHPFGWPSGVPGFAGGLDIVPRDNYLARLHQNEMVLTAQAAQSYRMAGGTATSAPSGGPGGGYGGHGQGGGQTVVVNNYHVGQVVANSPQEFVQKLSGNRMSSVEMQSRQRDYTRGRY